MLPVTDGDDSSKPTLVRWVALKNDIAPDKMRLVSGVSRPSERLCTYRGRAKSKKTSKAPGKVVLLSVLNACCTHHVAFDQLPDLSKADMGLDGRKDGVDGRAVLDVEAVHGSGHAIECSCVGRGITLQLTIDPGNPIQHACTKRGKGTPSDLCYAVIRAWLSSLEAEDEKHLEILEELFMVLREGMGMNVDVAHVFGKALQSSDHFEVEIDMTILTVLGGWGLPTEGA
ncbi:hypothetical protein KCU81_g224, partial [Aureobasidium melanogenum]